MFDVRICPPQTAIWPAETVTHPKILIEQFARNRSAGMNGFSVKEMVQLSRDPRNRGQGADCLWRLIRRFDAKLFDLLIQRVAVDAEEVGGLGFDVAAFGQGAVDE